MKRFSESFEPRKTADVQTNWRKYHGSVRSKARNDLRHVAAVKIYMGIMLLSQAGLIKVELIISLEKEAKQNFGILKGAGAVCGEDLQGERLVHKAIGGFRALDVK